MPTSSRSLLAVADEAQLSGASGCASMIEFGIPDGRWLRARFFAACGSLVALLVAAPASGATFEVRAVMSKDGAEVYFDPVGLRIQPGDTVRWIQVNGYHSV